MENRLLNKAADFMLARRRRKRWQKIVSGMASVVVFCTTYALILPAITMSNDVICGLEEHSHTEECWTTETRYPQSSMACTFTAEGVVAHEHDSLCRSEDGTLICTMDRVSQHSHGDTCYEEEKSLICTETEELGHAHSDACYTNIQGEMVCTQAEDAGHSHGETCYQVSSELTCTDESEEHSHEAGCYTENRTLTCQEEERPGHTHDDSCYSWTQEQSCTEEERPAGHIHGDECYQTDTVLTCEQEELVLHTHEADCYDEAGTLTCELPEVAAHQHTTDCIIPAEGEPWEEQVLTCGMEEHIHSEECCDNSSDQESAEEEQMLICELEESENHTHTTECYAPAQVQDEDPAAEEEAAEEESDWADAYANVIERKTTFSGKMFLSSPSVMAMNDTGSTYTTVSGTKDMTSMIDAVTVYEKVNGAWSEVGNGGTITQGEDLKFVIDYTVPGLTLSDKVNTLTYTIPKTIKNVRSTSGTVYNDAKEAVGTYVIDAATNKISITFGDDYVDDSELNKAIKGSISFYATVEEITQGGDETTDILFSDKVTINMEVAKKEDVVGDVDVEKSITEIDGSDLKFTITVTSKTGTYSQVTLTDKMTGGDNHGLQYLEGFTVKKGSTTVSGVTPPAAGSSEFAVTLPKMAAGDTYTITYVARPVGTINYGALVNNKASVSSTNSSNVKIDDFAEVEHTYNFVKKTGELQNDGSIAWTIVINQDKQDISGWVLQDLMYDTDGSEVWNKGPVTITDSNGKSSQITLPYTFRDGSKDTYTITYTTTHDTVAGDNSVTNIAGLFFGGGNNYFQDYDWVGIGTNKPVTKEGKILQDGGGTGPFIIEWTINVNTSEGPLPAGSTIEDKLDTNQYMTHAQLMNAFKNAQDALIAAGLLPDYAWATAVVNGTTVSVGYNDIKADGADKIYNYFTGFTIRLDKSKEVPQGTTFSFSFEVTSDDPPKLGYFQNRVNVNGGAEDTAQVKYGDSRPSISKDGIDPNNDFQKLPQNKEMDYKNLYEVAGEKMLWWKVRLTIPKDFSIEEPKSNDSNQYLRTPVITIKETLPEGMELVGTIAVPIELPISGGVTKTPDENGYAEFKWSDGWFLVTMQVSDGEDGRQIVTYSLNYPLATLIRDDPDPYMDLYIAATFKDGFAWGEGDAIVTQVPFTNTASVVSPNGTEFDKDTHTFLVNYDKSGEVVSKVGALNELNELEYAVVLNEKGRDLDPDNDTIHVVDVLTYVSPEAWPIELYLKPGSVKVYDYTGGVKGDLITTVKYTYDEQSEGATYTHTLNLTIPDSQPLMLEYVYNVDGTYNESYSYDMINTCTITGIANGSVSDGNNLNIKIYDSEASANTTGVYIYKVDQDNNGLYLPGAVFNLYTWHVDENGNGGYVRVKHPHTDGSEEEHYAFTTSAEEEQYGFLILNQKTVENIAYNTAYKLVEVTPPTGYFKEPDPYYFYIYNENTAQNPYKLPVVNPKDFAGDRLKDGALIYYKNEPAVTEISIEKKWLDHNGGSLTVTADQVSSVTVELWQKEQGAEGPGEKYGEYTLTPDAKGNWKTTITNLPKGIVTADKTKGTQYQYYIKEVAVPGYAVDDYHNNDGINTGTITVTNREVEGYELPETGGGGTTLYTAGGSALILCAGFLLLYNHTKRREEDLISS